MWVLVELGWHQTYQVAVGRGMGRFWEAEPELLILWLALLAVGLTIACYVIEKIRPKPVQKEPEASKWLSKCRELHAKGGLSDQEFRTIRTTLTTQLQEKLKDNAKPD